MYFLHSELIVGSLGSDDMPHRAAITTNWSLVGVHTCGYRYHLRALILLLTLSVKTIKDGQVGQIELHRVAVVYEIADGI